MATFMLVHGANLGGWCWRLVAPSLRFAGHAVFAPSLTGCGDRSHLLSPQIGIETWIEDVTSLMFHEDMDNVVLVGHSNGGAVIQAVADRMPQRVAHVVYLDALVPLDGESLWDLIPEGTRAWMERQQEAMGETWKSPAAPVEGWIEVARAEGWNEVIGRWAGMRAGWQPLKPGRDRIKLKVGELVEKLPRTYLRCTLSQAAAIERMAERAGELGWQVVELPAGHMPFFSDPQLLVEALLEIAEPYGA